MQLNKETEKEFFESKVLSLGKKRNDCFFLFTVFFISQFHIFIITIKKINLLPIA